MPQSLSRRAGTAYVHRVGQRVLVAERHQAGHRPVKSGGSARREQSAPRVLDVSAVTQLQRQVGNLAVAGLIVQRDKKRGRKAPAKVGGGHQQLWVIRDKSIGLGGQLVADLAAFKSRVMATADADGWTLVLAIHGSEDRLGAQAPPNWQQNAVFYDKSDIEALFGGDKAFVTWRDKYGPTALALVSCQVSAPFEDALIKNLTRTGDNGGRQPKRGLGEGCKPMTTALSLGGVPSSKARFDRLTASGRETALDELDVLNQKWGYYGAPPVPRDLIAHYYYNESPKGEWVKVEVGIADTSTHQLKPSGIPFWNRTFGPEASKFRRHCSQGIGTLRQHKTTAPPVADEE